MISEKVKNQIQVVQGDITKLDCDCIVNAANRIPFCAVGVDAHIDPPSKMKTPPRGGRRALLYRVSFFTP